MKNLIFWVRNNLITTIAIAAAVLSLGLLGVVHLWGSGFQEQLQARQARMAELDRLMRSSVEVPPVQPDGQPETVNVAVNPVVIDQMRTLYGRMSSESERIFSEAVNINQQNHETLLPGLFPEPADAALPFEARDLYRQTFVEMRQAQGESDNLPHLNAGMPPAAQVLIDQASLIERDMMGQGQNLSPQDAEKLRSEQAGVVMDLLRGRAEQIDIYAVTDPQDPGFPYQVGAWASSGATRGLGIVISSGGGCSTSGV